MKTYIKNLSIGMATLMAVFALVVSFAAGRAIAKDNEHGDDNDHAKMSASVFARSEFEQRIINNICNSLPPGIAKKVEICQEIVSNPNPDTTAPVISDIKTVSIRTTGFQVMWRTNERTTGKVYYSTTSGFNIADANVKSVNETHWGWHRASINGLTPNTTYYFVVVAKDRAGNSTTSAQSTVLTLTQSTSDDVAPSILGVIVGNITDSSATLTVRASEDVSVKVVYNIVGGSEVKTQTVPGFASTQLVALSGLKSDTDYQAKVTVTDRNGNSKDSDMVSWKTSKDVVAPQITDLSVTTSYVAKSATIKWQTNEASDSKVIYSQNAALLTDTSAVAADASMVTSHQLVISNVETKKIYYFRIESKDSMGNMATSAVGSFIVNVPILAPVQAVQ